MRGGTLVHRQWILVMRNGDIVVDWGDGVYQDIFSGAFIPVKEAEISHSAQNEDLEMLKRASRVDHYDSQRAWLINLPERPVKTID